jgi:hypothetical protein
LIKSILILPSLIFLLAMNDIPKESNEDLRTTSKIFELVQVSGKTDEKLAFALQGSNDKEYNLEMMVGDKREKVVRLSTATMKEVDQKFVDSFFQLSFVLAPYEGKSCQSQYRLEMRGEKIEVCTGEASKLAVIDGLVNFLRQYQ